MPDNLRFCCVSGDRGPKVNSDNPDKKEVFLQLMNIRDKALEGMKNHILPKECEGCACYREYDIDSPDTPKEITEKLNEKPLISYIIVNHFRQCDCFCIYCTLSRYHKKIITKSQKSDYYDLFPIIKQLYKEKLIDTQNLNVEFQGGSIGVLKEFPDLIKIFLKNGIKTMQFFTNGIKYMPQIPDVSKKAGVILICSVDAGSRQTFKKIKLVDKFDDVIKNLKKYSEKSKNIEINAKYILQEGLNDNKEELSGFFDAVSSAKVHVAQLDLDFKKVMMNKGVRYDIPQHYYELFDFFREQCSKHNLIPSVNSYIQQILDKGYFE